MTMVTCCSHNNNNNKNNNHPFWSGSRANQQDKKISHAPSFQNTTSSVLRIRGGGKGGNSNGANNNKSSSSSAAIEGFKNSIASGLAACCAKTLLQPFDTIKTMQQHYQGDDRLGLVEAARLVMERGNGIQELYAGLAVSALGSIPSIGLYYGVYSYCKRILIPLLQDTYGGDLDTRLTKKKASLLHFLSSLSDAQLKWLAVALSAALGNTVASFSRVPYEVVKQKLQTGVYESTWVAISSMFQSGGIRAFFPMGGVRIQMIRDIPYAIFTLLAYEILRDIYVHPYPSSPVRDLMVGATAGGFGSYMTNGLDVIKTRLQTSPEVYGGSVLQCISMTWQEGGLRAFMRGSLPRLLHKVPANGSFFVFYEFFRRLLRVQDAMTATPATTRNQKGKRE